MDCRVNTLHINEYYMVQNEIWRAAVPSGPGMLCIGCLEARLGRLLVKEDFTDVPVNSIFPVQHSGRLLTRISGLRGEQLLNLLREKLAATARAQLD